MAKLGAYYGLCPLIDQRNLLGVNEDVEQGHVIVTLGKNIAIKYRLSDQKQTHSWRTKDKFSSAVIYDRESSQYIAVFNQVYLRIWKGEEEYLDKLKKYKFNNPIYALTTCNNKSFIIFKNGVILPLNFAIENRKNLNQEDVTNIDNYSSAEILSFAQKDDIYIGILLKAKNKVDFVWKLFDNNNESYFKIKLSRTGLKLSGQVLCHLYNQRNINLLTLWSDGKLYSYTIGDQSEDKIQESPNLFAVVEYLSCIHPVTLVYLNSHTIAMYGADSNEEGASLILYNTQFKVSQSKQSLKLFTSGAKLWQLENNLLFCIGQNLAVIPFYLDTEQLAALVGSHKTALADLDPDIMVVEELIIADWSDDIVDDAVEKAIPITIKEKVLELSKQGLSEATICDQLLPEYIKNNDIQAILSCIDYFRDIPESFIAKLLRFCLTADSKYFKNAETVNSKLLPANLQLERCMMLDKILMTSFSDIILLPHIQIELDLNCIILLLQYICYLMSEDGHSLSKLNSIISENKLIEWGCLLLDANYQKFVLSKDPKILEILVSYSKLVDKYLMCLEKCRQVVPLLTELRRGKDINKYKQMTNLKYSIEQLSLY